MYDEPLVKHTLREPQFDNCAPPDLADVNRGSLASPEAVRSVCRELRARMPDVIPYSEKHLMRFLYAVRHVERRPAKARSVRAEVLRAHLISQGSQKSLRARVKEILGEVVSVSTEQMANVVRQVDELLEIDPSDKCHLFYEEMKRLFYAMREIQPEDIDDESLDQFMTAADQLSNAIYSIELKRRKKTVSKMVI